MVVLFPAYPGGTLVGHRTGNNWQRLRDSGAWLRHDCIGFRCRSKGGPAVQSEQQSEQELERAHEIAWAKLGVAEDVGWIAACFAGIAAYLAWSSWIVGIVVLGGGFYAITLSYRSELERAKETYYRAAKLGAYSGRWGPKTPEDDSE